MPHGGIPPEVADEILQLVKEHRPTLLEIIYRSHHSSGANLLSRSSANLVDTLYVNPELGQLCRDLQIRHKSKEATDLVRQHTEPIAETMRELFERVPNLVSFALEEQDEAVNRISTLERTVAEALQGWQGWTTLRQLRLPRLEDTLLPLILGMPRLAVLQVVSASSKYPVPSDLLPPFSLQHLQVTHKFDDSLFRCGTANSHESLVRLTVPFSFDLKNHLGPFANLRHLCLDFSSYNLGGYTWNRERLQELKHFLAADTRLTSVQFSSPEPPRSGRIHVLHSALPRNLEALILHPWPLVTQDALRCIEVGMSKQLWSSSLARIVWTSDSSYGRWSTEDIERVRSKCLEHGIADVQFLEADGAVEA